MVEILLIPWSNIIKGKRKTNLRKFTEITYILTKIKERQI